MSVSLGSLAPSSPPYARKYARRPSHHPPEMRGSADVAGATVTDAGGAPIVVGLRMFGCWQSRSDQAWAARSPIAEGEQRMDGYGNHDAAAGSNGDPSRRAVVRGVGGLGLAAFFATRWAPAAAQDTTPAPTGAVGVTVQVLGTGQPASAPGLELTLRRLTIAPGGLLPAHSHPGALVIFVEAGTWGYTVLGGTAQLTRAAVGGTPTPAEEMPAGAEVVLTAGDWIFIEDPQDEFRNAGEEDVVLVSANLAQIGEPFTTLLDMEGMEMGGTPTS